MGYSSLDDLMSKLSGGKSWRADFMKTTSGIGTVVAGRWYDLTPFPGYPQDYIHGNLVSNYNFLAGASNWTYSAGFAWTPATHLMTKSNTGSVETLSQTVDMVAGGVYEVIYTLGSYAGSGNVSVSMGGGTAIPHAANGTFTDTVTAGSSNKNLLFSCATTITALTIDVVYVRRLLHFTPYYDIGTAMDVTPWHGGAVTPNTKHLLNMGIWSNVAAGCPAVLMVVDMLGCYPKIASNSGSVQPFGQNDHVNNGAFTGNASGWTLGAGWTYNSNAVDKGAGAGNLSQTLATSPIAGRTYLITYTITNYSVSGLLTIQLGGGSTSRTITANGTYTDSILATGAGDLIFQTVDAARFTIDIISCGWGLPRYPDGKGVRPFLVVNTAPGTGSPNFSMNYTNPDLVRSRNLGAVCTTTASPIVSHLSISGVAAGNFGPFLPLAAAETGIIQAQDCLWSVGSGSAGFHDLVLCKPLATIPLTAAFYAAERDFLNQLPSLPQVKDGAVLGFIIFAGAVIPNPCMYQGYIDLGWS